MGRVLVLQKIRHKAVKMIIGNGLMGIWFSFCTAVLSQEHIDYKVIFVAVLALLTLGRAVMGGKQLVNPMCARCLKKNPKMLELADELINDMIYQDKFITYSNRIIASTKDITQIVLCEDVIDMHEKTFYFNGITTEHGIVLAVPDYEIQINIFARKRETIESIECQITERCPKIRVKV